MIDLKDYQEIAIERLKRETNLGEDWDFLNFK